MAIALQIQRLNCNSNFLNSLYQTFFNQKSWQSKSDSVILEHAVLSNRSRLTLMSDPNDEKKNIIFWSRLRYNNLSVFVELCIDVYRFTPKTFMIPINIFAPINIRSMPLLIEKSLRVKVETEKKKINKFFSVSLSNFIYWKTEFGTRGFRLEVITQWNVSIINSRFLFYNLINVFQFSWTGSIPNCHI